MILGEIQSPEQGGNIHLVKRRRAISRSDYASDRRASSFLFVLSTGDPSGVQRACAFLVLSTGDPSGVLEPGFLFSIAGLEGSNSCAFVWKTRPAHESYLLRKEFLGCRTGAGTETRPYRGFHCSGRRQFRHERLLRISSFSERSAV